MAVRLPAGVFARLARLPVRRDEVAGVAWSFVSFFCLLSAYYILRPMRDAHGVGVGPQWLPVLFTGTFVTLLAITPLWGALVSRVPPGRLLPWTYRFLALNLVVFFVVFRQVHHWLPAAVFFVWISVFNLMATAIFWSFMTDVWRPEQGKRVFGLIAAGGSAGAIVGPALTAALVRQLGPELLLLLAVGLLEAAVFCQRRTARWARTRPAPPAIDPAAAKTPEPPADESRVGGTTWAGITALARSPYLAAIAAYTLIAIVSGTFNYNLQARLVSEQGQGHAQITQLFAGLDLITNVLTVGLQALVIGPLLTRRGVGSALRALPLISGLGFATASFLPVLPLVAGMQVLRRAAAYGIVVPSYGVLFSQVSREQKYKVRAAIDTVVYRAGDVIGGWSFAGLMALGLGVRGVAGVIAVMAIPWLWLTWFLGRSQAPVAGPAGDQVNAPAGPSPGGPR